MQTTTHYLGLVVTQCEGFLLASDRVEGRPNVNHLASLLGNAMQRPLFGDDHRPSRILLRGHRQWQELFPHLKELGIEVIFQGQLRQAEEAYEDYLRQMRELRRSDMVELTAEQATVESLFPAIAKWVRGYGHIEIGDQEMFGFVARALDYGGMVFEDEKAETLAEAMAVLEKTLAAWFQENEGIEP
jgi:hypothetical protein